MDTGVVVIKKLRGVVELGGQKQNGAEMKLNKNYFKPNKQIRNPTN